MISAFNISNHLKLMLTRMASSLTATTCFKTSIAASMLEKSFTGSRPRPSLSPSLVGLPALKVPNVTYSAIKSVKWKNSVNNGSLFLSAAAMGVGVWSPALALVDEYDRLPTERTGISLGLTDPVLGWILVGVFTVIWSLYFVYTSTLDEDEESGLSL